MAVVVPVAIAVAVAAVSPAELAIPQAAVPSAEVVVVERRTPVVAVAVAAGLQPVAEGATNKVLDEQRSKKRRSLLLRLFHFYWGSEAVSCCFRWAARSRRSRKISSYSSC